MKHPQHILAFYKEAFGVVLGGVMPMDISELKERAEQSLFIGRRHELEMNPDFGQMLPYFVLYNSSGIFTYQRTSKVGEQRLAGNYSVGIGGHVDFEDIVARDSVINFIETLAEAANRELDEELVFSYAESEQFKFSELAGDERAFMTPQLLGLINDTSNEVGRVHYGLLFVMRVPDNIAVRCAEDELSTVGFINPNALVMESPYKFENWSELAIKFLRDDHGLFVEAA